jgi:hypothetical protein
MAAEADAAATANEERAKMADRNAEKASSARRHEFVIAAGRARETAAFHRRRQQALEDGARLLEAAEAQAA